MNCGIITLVMGIIVEHSSKAHKIIENLVAVIGKSQAGVSEKITGRSKSVMHDQKNNHAQSEELTRGYHLRRVNQRLEKV